LSSYLVECSLGF